MEEMLDSPVGVHLVFPDLSLHAKQDAPPIRRDVAIVVQLHRDFLRLQRDLKNAQSGPGTHSATTANTKHTGDTIPDRTYNMRHQDPSHLSLQVCSLYLSEIATPTIFQRLKCANSYQIS